MRLLSGSSCHGLEIPSGGEHFRSSRSTSWRSDSRWPEPGSHGASREGKWRRPPQASVHSGGGAISSAGFGPGSLDPLVATVISGFTVISPAHAI